MRFNMVFVAGWYTSEDVLVLTSHVDNPELKPCPAGLAFILPFKTIAPDSFGAAVFSHDS